MLIALLAISLSTIVSCESPADPNDYKIEKEQLEKPHQNNDQDTTANAGIAHS